MRFKEYLLREDMMGGMPPGGGMAPPGGDPTGGGGMPPGGGMGGPPMGGDPMGGGGMPPGGGMGGPGGPGGMPGGGGQLDPQKNLQMKTTDVWETLEKILDGKGNEKKPSTPNNKNSLQSPEPKHLMA